MATPCTISDHLIRAVTGSTGHLFRIVSENYLHFSSAKCDWFYQQQIHLRPLTDCLYVQAPLTQQFTRTTCDLRPFRIIADYRLTKIGPVRDYRSTPR